MPIKKYKRSIVFFLNKRRMGHLLDQVAPFYQNESDVHKLTLWYTASNDLDYAFHKCHDIWGIDSLSDTDKKAFNLLL